MRPSQEQSQSGKQTKIKSKISAPPLFNTWHGGHQEAVRHREQIRTGHWVTNVRWGTLPMTHQWKAPRTCDTQHTAYRVGTYSPAFETNIAVDSGVTQPLSTELNQECGNVVHYMEKERGQFKKRKKERRKVKRLTLRISHLNLKCTPVCLTQPKMPKVNCWTAVSQQSRSHAQRWKKNPAQLNTDI